MGVSTDSEFKLWHDRIIRWRGLNDISCIFSPCLIVDLTILSLYTLTDPYTLTA